MGNNNYLIYSHISNYVTQNLSNLSFNKNKQINECILYNIRWVCVVFILKLIVHNDYTHFSPKVVLMSLHIFEFIYNHHYTFFFLNINNNVICKKLIIHHVVLFWQFPLPKKLLSVVVVDIKNTVKERKSIYQSDDKLFDQIIRDG
jgi:hypothetical protein